MKKWALIALIIVFALLALLLLFFIFSRVFGMSGWVCEGIGGRVSNDQAIVENMTIGNSSVPVSGSVCKDNERNIGSVKGRKCFCICCLPK